MTEFDPNQFESLRSALRAIHPAGPAVPREVDEAILSDARRSFAARRRRWMLIQRVGAGLGAVAVLAIAVRVFHSGAAGPAAPRVQHAQLAQFGDINHDGHVDILDAFSVARAIARHERLDPAWDVNGDRVVDQRDVDLIAHMAVQTGGGTRQ